MGHPTTVMPPRNRTQTPPQPPVEPVTPVAPAPDLTLSKVLAVAGAGATSAVLGSLFGVAGTVLGAAVGAVLTTVATTLYQRSLDRARSVVTARLRSQGPTSTDDLDTVVMAPPARPGEQPTELIAPADLPGRSRRRIVGYVLATVIGFGLALGLVTGIEALKGSTLLKGESGTSVGRVLQGGPRASVTPTPDPSDSDDDSGGSGKSQYDHDKESSEPTTEPSGSVRPTTGTPRPSSTPSAEPSGGLGGLLGSNGGSNGSGDANPGRNG
ncbi:hypothetical protein ACQEVB_05260 [Pseudonocardia sp. CA-107938]|uniref:hypothetical protein n=1 Tax=Pseudonocardia sp. CA-107938 TaxID=3240021 RepID=UPI003D90558A